VFGKHKRYSVFVLLPHTENGLTCKTEHGPLPYRSLQVRNKKSGVYSGVGECYNKDKWANSYYVRNVVESLLESRLHFAHKLARNLISRLNIVSIAISAWTAKPCPREEMGYKCRKGSSQKCECEK